METDRHQRHLEDEPQSVIETPFESLVVTCRQQHTGSTELRRGADQRHEIAICFRDAVAEESYSRRIAGDATEMFDHRRRLLIDGVTQFAGSIEAVNLHLD